ncbi:MAG: hypothetical protein HY287_17155 [Planctomycetes bacterium]|nr:hypothetical protein [Planctomycetota bacterium]MBI3836056.1 hypothetical protein [Planctomycetota bacterium]
MNDEFDVPRMRATGRLSIVMSIALVIGLLILGFGLKFFAGGAARQLISGGQVWDTSQFNKPLLLADDGRTILFSYTRSEYRREGGGPMPFMGAAPVNNYLTDIKFIGAFDIEKDLTRVIVRDVQHPGSDGKGNFILQGTKGQVALVYREPTRDLQARYYLVDLKTTGIREIPLLRELSDQNLSPGWYYVIKEDGTLLIVTGPARSGPPYPIGEPSGYTVVVRTPRGEYIQVGKAKGYLGSHGDDLILDVRSSENSLQTAYSLTERVARPLSHQEGHEVLQLIFEERNRYHGPNFGISMDRKHVEIFQRHENGPNSHTLSKIDEKLLQ